MKFSEDFEDLSIGFYQSVAERLGEVLDLKNNDRRVIFL